MSDTPKTQDTEKVVDTQAPANKTSTESRGWNQTPRGRGGNNDRSGGRGKGRGKGRGGIREEMKEFQEEILSIDRVTRVTSGGRQLRFRVSLVIGDKKGRIGLGIGKSGEVQTSIEKALRDARKNIIKFPIKDGTIAHSVSVKYKSSMIFLHPAHPGTGIIAGGAARKVFAVSGIRDVIAKQHGSSNNISNARVTIKAVEALKPVAMIKDFGKKEEEAPKKTVAKKSPAKK